MNSKGMGFSRADVGKAVEQKRVPAQEFGRYSDVLERPTRMEAAGALTFTAFNTALEYGKDAIGIALWYGIGVSVMALEKAARMKKGF